jgi:hypothetical protein
LLVLSVAAASAVAQDADGETASETRVESRVDWLAGRFVLDIMVPLSADARNHAAAAYGAQESVEADLPQILQREAAAVRVDSYRTLGQHYGSRPELAVDIARLSAQLEPTVNRQTPDLRSLHLGYGLDLFPTLARLFVDHTRPRPLPRVLSWRPSREFTGIVIYAKGELPVHGEDRVTTLEPAMFPDIYDSDMGLVMEPDRVDPDVLANRGAAAYATDPTDPVVERRAGTRPLRTVAVGAFGRYGTDPIIPRQDAEVLFAVPANHQLIRDGRIVIIIEEAALD